MSNTLEAIITSPSLVREQWLTSELAVREVLAFERRFGSKHLMLACHAALPLILNPQLVNLIHINFLEDKQIPWVAEVDFLLSPLCRPIDEGLYEVEPSIREVLLVELENQFGWERPFQLAKFLQFYLAHNSGLQQPKKVIRTQQWIAQAYIDPDQVVEQLTNLFDSSLSEEAQSLSLSEQIHVTTTLELLAEPLERTNQQRKYEYLVSNSRVLAQILYKEEQELKQTILLEKLEEEIKEESLNILSPLILKQIVNPEISETESPESESTEAEKSVPLQNNQPYKPETSAEQVNDISVEYSQVVDGKKAREVERRYAAGERNFSYMDLRGQSFKDRDLSGVDFSRADIRGADFTRANLRGANFTQVKAGAQFLGFLRTTKFNDADLTDADFTGALLKNTDFRQANLERTRWSRAQGLDTARLEGTYLKGSEIQRLLVTLQGEQKNFDALDLRGVNLQGANLTNASFIETNLIETNLIEANLIGANLIGANLIGANLIGANLIGANLSGANLSGANLTGANLTGACIQDWLIKSQTNLYDVICDYVYLKEGQQERRPSDPNRNFEPGEFSKLVKRSMEAVDLIFSDGIDWATFLSSFQDLQVEYGDQNVSIQAIEKKSDGAFVIRLSVPSDTDKAYIESRAKESYETNLKILEAQYRNKLQLKDRQMEIYKQQSADMMKIIELQANRPPYSNLSIVNNNSEEIKDSAKVAGNMNAYASEQKQTLAEAAEEIQKLLKQLKQTNPTATLEQQQAYVDAAIPLNLKARCIDALKAGGETAIEEFLDNPYVNVGKAVVKGWMKPE